MGRSMSETLETLKKDKAKYLDMIDKQKKIIEQLKEENSSMKTKTIRVKSMEKLLTPIRGSPRPVLRNVGNTVLEEDHCRYTPRPILMKPILTPSNSEEEAISVDSSSSLDIDFSDIFTIDSDSEEEMI